MLPGCKCDSLSMLKMSARTSSGILRHPSPGLLTSLNGGFLVPNSNVLDLDHNDTGRLVGSAKDLLFSFEDLGFESELSRLVGVVLIVDVLLRRDSNEAEVLEEANDGGLTKGSSIWRYVEELRAIG